MENREKSYHKIVKVKQIHWTIVLVLFLLFGNSLSASILQINVQSQLLTVNVNEESIKNIFSVIENNSEYVFFYPTHIDLNRKVTIDIQKGTINQVLTELFRGTNITFSVSGKQVYVKMKTTTSQIEQENRGIKVKGNVTDFNGQPLAGVSIQQKGTTNGTISDIDGSYSISVPDKYAILVFSYIGFVAKEETIGSREIVNVVMSEDVGQLEEVVVVGYGTQKKVSVVGSVSNISVGEIKKAATPSLSNTLGGQLPGIITRQATGEPGYDQASVYIRGIASWVNRNPLILVDGIERDMNNINTEEIESISILKDASATAVYGVKGANGVILITTKRGEIGKPKVSIRTEFAAVQALRLPEYINSAEYAGLINEGRANVGKPARYTDTDIALYADGSDPYLHPNVDWVNEILKKNTFQNITNMNVTGGSEIVRYFVNAGYTTLGGLYKTDSENNYNTNVRVDRYNFRSRIEINLTKHFLIDLGIGGIIQKGNYPNMGQYDIYYNLRATPPLAFPKQNPDGSVGGIMSFLGSNPWAVMTQSGYKVNNRNTLQSTFGVKWDLSELVSKGLSLSGRFSYDYYSDAWNTRSKVFEVKQYLGKDENGNDQYTVLREATPMTYSSGNSSNRALYSEASLNYDRAFNKIHNVSAMLLYNRRDYVDINASSSILNLPYRRQGLAGRFTYDYDHRYLTEFNFGYNGSEQFPKGKRYGFFPSISAGWVLSNEAFWKASFIDNLKIRGSIGKVGNDISNNARRFLYLTTIDKNGPSYPFGQTFNWYQGIQEGQIGTSDVTWETATKANVGFDISFFNKLSLQVDAFSEKRKGILIERQRIPDIYGYLGNSIPQGNLGKAKNYGVDGALEFKNQTTSGVFYSLRANFSYAHNEIIENDTPLPKYDYLDSRGHPIDQPFGLIALGLFKDDEEIANSPKQTFQEKVRPGDIKYKDINNDGVIDSYDRVAIGYPRMPEIMYGFGGTISYKGFDASIFFTGATRTSLFLAGLTIWPSMDGEGSSNILREYYENRWTPETAGTAKYPAITDNKNENNFQTSTLYMRDGTYLKLKNAEIGYTLDKKLTRKINIDNLRFFVNGLNLYSWDKIKIVDPESNDGTNSGTGAYPTSRTFNVGLKVNF